MQGVQRRRVLGHERDQEKIRKGDARESHHELEFLGARGEARRNQTDERRHEEERQDEDDRLGAEKQREDAVGKPMRRRGSAFGFRLGVARHIGRVERAFPEDRAEMVRQAERVGESLVHHARAQHRRDHDVPDEAGDARDQRPAADAEDMLSIGLCEGA